MRVYYIDKPSEPLSPEDIKKVGVLSWVLDADNWEKEGLLDRIKKERNYKNSDVIVISRERMGDLYEEKVKIFAEEHLHDDEEIRFILDGSGYFDVRSLDDNWIRIHVFKNDLIVLPKGIYHRFVIDEKEYIKAMRLFQDEPKWTPINRNLPTTDGLPSRVDYIKEFAV
eukprot:TRINITY_DN5032_c0_g1_i1.p1 TRINITY_DN5032_c0_g1~~TRINITY_DN5032_c0_g1_i1.p1  ORF type:complete len:169 (-),score=30.53 TRINITY_DN5032_c0_g1_i1:109-615(-)